MALKKIPTDASAATDSPQSIGYSPMHTLEIEGRIALFVKGMPEEFISAMGGDLPGMNVFMYGWINGERGVSSLVSFPKPDGNDSHSGASHELGKASDAKSEHIRSVDKKSAGKFRMSLDVLDGDPKYLKLQACVRVKDPESHNIRNFNVAVSCADLVRMMHGQEDSFTMTDQFIEGNAVDVAMRVVNADQFRNHASCSGDLDKPLIKFGDSALDKIGKWNEIVERISCGLMKSMNENKISTSAGCENFKMGITWYVNL
jgi:hypothetical protein